MRTVGHREDISQGPSADRRQDLLPLVAPGIGAYRLHPATWLLSGLGFRLVKVGNDDEEEEGGGGGGKGGGATRVLRCAASTGHSILDTKKASTLDPHLANRTDNNLFSGHGRQDSETSGECTGSHAVSFLPGEPLPYRPRILHNGRRACVLVLLEEPWRCSRTPRRGQQDGEYNRHGDDNSPHFFPDACPFPVRGAAARLDRHAHDLRACTSSGR